MGDTTQRFQLLGKIIITGKLKTRTGLHIGGSKSSLTIGGIDNSVIRDAKDRPYIPGSSLKGKLRSLLAKSKGSLFFSQKEKELETKVVDELRNKNSNPQEKALLDQYRSYVVAEQNTDEDFEEIMELFGYSGDNDGNSKRIGYTQLLVRDAFLDENGSDKNIFNDKQGGNKKYADGKWENVINRRTGTADNPRQMERVPVGTSFKFELVYNMYGDPNDPSVAKGKAAKHLNAVMCALQLLEDDGIGGQISRGYGQVGVEELALDCKLITDDYSYHSYKMVEGDASTGIQQLLESASSRFPKKTDT